MPTLKRTQEQDQLHNQLYTNAVRRLREVLPPQSIAARIYPKLKTDAEHRLQEKRSQQKE